MAKFQIGGQADAAEELESLLRYNGFDFQRQGGRFRLVFADRGCKWETVCACVGQTALFYGYYPFIITNQTRASALCEEVNRQVLFGSMLTVKNRAAFRTGADLFDAYSAYEHIGRALEYNAAVVVRFWKELAACAAAKPGDPDGLSISI